MPAFLTVDIIKVENSVENVEKPVFNAWYKPDEK
jgi:hypothetical protein